MLLYRSNEINEYLKSNSLKFLHFITGKHMGHTLLVRSMCNLSVVNEFYFNRNAILIIVN